MTEQLKPKAFRSKLNQMKLFDYLIAAFMTAFCISIVFPFWDMFTLSLTPTTLINTLVIHLWPEKTSWENYAFILRNSKLINAFGISVFRTVAGMAVHIIVICLAAYPLSKRKMPYRSILVVIFLIPMFFGGGLIPSFLINKALGLRNNLLVYILPSAFSMYNCVIVRNYFMSIDPALEESAHIDGASIPRILFNIIIPLSKPVLATVALWTMVGQWNSWFDAMIYMSDEKLIPIQLILRRLLSNISELSGEMRDYAMKDPNNTLLKVSTKGVQAAMTIMTITPIICVYPFIQKYFVKGIMLGSVKG